MNYIIAYLLPFVSDEGMSTKDAVTLTLFFLVLAVVYISSNLIHINPLLSFLGYRILEVETTTGDVCILITRRRYAPPGTSLEAIALSEELFLEKR